MEKAAEPQRDPALIKGLLKFLKLALHDCARADGNKEVRHGFPTDGVGRHDSAAFGRGVVRKSGRTNQAWVANGKKHERGVEGESEVRLDRGSHR